MTKDSVFVACIRAYRGQEEVARIDVAVAAPRDYYPVRDAVMEMPGVDRIEIVSLRRRKTYVRAENGELLFEKWKEEVNE